MPSLKSAKTSKSVDVVSNYIRHISERERKKAKGEIIEFQPFDVYFVGKVTKILGDARVEATNGTKTFQAKIDGKFRGRDKKSNFISGGCYVLLECDDSYTKPVYILKAVVDRESVDIIHKITPINESLLIVSSSDGKKDDGIEFDRSATKEDSDESGDVDVDKV